MEHLAWWEKLPDKFHQYEYKTELEEKQNLKIKTVATMDKVCRTGLAMFFYAAIRKIVAEDDLLKNEVESLSFYKDLTKNNDKSQIFVQPPKDVEIKKEYVSSSVKLPINVFEIDKLYFQSPFNTINPKLSLQYAQMSKNTKAVAQHWKHGDQPRPTIIFIHGVVLNSYRRNSRIFELNWLYQQGYDILFYTLPFHGSRKETHDLVSGLGFFSNGFAHINEAMLQAVFDLRIWMDYLEKTGVTQMGLVGFSLGGYVTALAASIDKRLAFAIPFAPMVLPIDMLMGWPLLSGFFNTLKSKHSVDIRYLRQATAIHHALNWQPVIDTKKLMVIGGAGDRFTSPIFVQQLHKHWKGSQMFWYEGNHLLFLNHKQSLLKIKKFIDQCCEV